MQRLTFEVCDRHGLRTKFSMKRNIFASYHCCQSLYNLIILFCERTRSGMAALLLTSGRRRHLLNNIGSSKRLQTGIVLEKKIPDEKSREMDMVRIIVAFARINF